MNQDILITIDLLSEVPIYLNKPQSNEKQHEVTGQMGPNMPTYSLGKLSSRLIAIIFRGHLNDSTSKLLLVACQVYNIRDYAQYA